MQGELIKPKKTWREKLADDKGLPKICEVSEKMSERWGPAPLVVPAPAEVDALMREIPQMQTRHHQ